MCAGGGVLTRHARYTHKEHARRQVLQFYCGLPTREHATEPGLRLQQRVLLAKPVGVDGHICCGDAGGQECQLG